MRRRRRRPAPGGAAKGKGASVPPEAAKKHREPRSPQAKPSTRAPKRASRLLVVTGVAGIAIACAVFFARRSRTLDPFPPPPPALTDSVAFADFLGADSCTECHAAESAAWSASTHGHAGGAPDDVRLLSAFDGRPIRFADAIVTPRTDAGGHVFDIAWDGRPVARFIVEGVVGGGHMVGGGTQGFLTRYEDGSLRFLPFERVRDENTWFCNTNTRLDRGWLPITDSLRLTDCGDWPPVRVFGNIARYANCQECHGSQITVAAEPGRPQATNYRSLAIDCESCHGPGRQHVEIVKNADGAGTAIGMTALATLSKDASVKLCLRCHALKDGLQPDYLPGRSFDEHYSVELPFLSDAPVFADGRIRTFAYQQGHLWSDCYVSGSMTCVDCHDPHSQQYRDADYQQIAGRFADAQCTSCHPSKAASVTAHTHHAETSAGSRCVSCHMPYLQEPEVGDAIRYARSDHTIPVPRPAADAALGIRNACQTCHTGRDAQSLDQQARAWWGEFKPRPAAVQSLLQADRAGLDSALAAMPATTPVPARAIALGRLLRERLSADMAAIDDATYSRLEIAAADADPDIAALGLAGLHYARGTDVRTRRFLVERIGTLGVAERAVRSRWAVLLGFVGDELRAARQFDAAVTAYDKALEIDPGNPGVLLNRGLALTGSGRFADAENAFVRSLLADSANVLTWVNVGIARAALGNEGGAIAAYRSASRINPFDGLPYFNLGNLHLRADRAAEAATAYQRATEYSPALPDAHFNLARARILLGQLDAARTALEDGLAFEPSNAPAREALARIDSTLQASNGRR